MGYLGEQLGFILSLAEGYRSLEVWVIIKMVTVFIWDILMWGKHLPIQIRVEYVTKPLWGISHTGKRTYHARQITGLFCQGSG